MLPTFETERLIVRPSTFDDLEACIAMERDAEVVRYVGGSRSDAKKHRAIVTERITTRYPDGLGYWSVVPRTMPDRFLGWVSLFPYQYVGPEIEIGWRFIRAAWGKGYATDAAIPIVRHAFDTVGLERIVADVAPGNARSTRVAQKLGLIRGDDRRRAGSVVQSYTLTRDGPAMR